LRILVITSSFPRFPGDSSGVFILNLCKELQKLGIEIEVLAPHDYRCSLHEFWEGIEISRFPYFYPYRFQRLCYGAGILKNLKESVLALIQLPFFILAELSYALHIARKRNCDLVHAHWSVPQGLTGLFLKRLCGIPCVTSLHGSDVFGLRAILLRGLNRRVILGSDACTANSKATAAAAREVSGRKDISVIPMGVNVDFFKSARSWTNGYTENGPNILYAGRLIDWKGVQYLIEAIPKVLEMHPRVRLTIIGSGPLKSSLLELSGRLHLRNHVQFIDDVSQEELVRYYSMADVFILPSVMTDAGETEGLGVVLLEAMACGVPVIGSAIGGIPDIIEDGQTGLLAFEKNPYDLAEKIHKLLSDEDLRKRVTEKGFRFVKKEFSWDVVARKFKKVYEDALLTLRSSNPKR
jgi:glycosyltransferase involved in cell wall biosynthesis